MNETPSASPNRWVQIVQEREPASNLVFLACLAFVLTGGTFGSGELNAQQPESVVVGSELLRFELQPRESRWTITDLRSSVEWGSDPLRPGFGEITIEKGGQRTTVQLENAAVERGDRRLTLTFFPVRGESNDWVRIEVRVSRADTLEMSYQSADSLNVQSIRLLSRAMP
ncbi:MAG: hypothetical protein N3G20_07515, partial [Verrucomicrobiae bacterium]|nr:hypothetical protein [Verrucomicrobiae bacterium]